MVLINGIGTVNGYEIHPGANLRGANLRGANLRDADLRDADLRDADLRDADLRDAYVSSAILINTDLRGATLIGTDFFDATLTGADLRGATLRDTIFVRAILENMRFSPDFYYGAILTESDEELYSDEDTFDEDESINNNIIDEESQFEIDVEHLQNTMVEPNINMENTELQNQINIIRSFIDKYLYRLDSFFINKLNDDLEHTIATLERKQLITQEEAAIKKAQTINRITQMRLHASSAAAATAAVEVNEYGICPICQEPIKYNTDICEAHNKGIIIGGHFMHKRCFQSLCKQKGNKLCPLCNLPIKCNNYNKPMRASRKRGEILKGGKNKKKRLTKKKYRN